MPTASYVKYTAAVEPLVEGDNAGAAAWKIALAATINVADTSFVAGTTDLATGGGYTQGGNAASTTSSTQSAGTYSLVLSSPAVWTASGGGFTFRYAILYNSTTNIPYASYDYGSSQVVASGETVTVTMGASAFTVT